MDSFFFFEMQILQEAVAILGLFRATQRETQTKAILEIIYNCLGIFSISTDDRVVSGIGNI